MPEVNTHASNVRLIGGRLCLDFVNTVNDHSLASPKEYLPGYAELIAWSQHAGALGAQPARALLALAAEQPGEARAALARAKRLRSALYGIFMRAPIGQELAASDLAAFNDALARAPRRERLVQAPAGLSWEWAGGAPLEQPLWPVIWSSADLLSAPEIVWVRQCAGAGCGWLFLDISVNHTRRWCSMEDCGNRAKARRYYAQRRGDKVTR